MSTDITDETSIIYSGRCEVTFPCKCGREINIHSGELKRCDEI
jgi:hypothetical protein